jgi:hypothetical protein
MPMAKEMRPRLGEPRCLIQKGKLQVHQLYALLPKCRWSDSS